MNRIQLGPLAKIPVPAAEEKSRTSVEQAPFCPPGFEHSIFIPMHYESGYAYPVIVWLHSGGGDEQQLFSVMPYISTRNYVAVAIGGTDNHSEGGRNWLQSPESIETAQYHVHQAIELVSRRLNVHRGRVFIAGRGQGGTMAFRLAFSKPSLFAGVASIGGSLPCNLTPLCNWWKCRNLPVFWSQGRRSESFPEANLCRQLQLLHVAGFSVTLRQYPCGDDMPDQCYDDLNDWVMEQISKSGESSIVC